MFPVYGSLDDLPATNGPWSDSGAGDNNKTTQPQAVRGAAVRDEAGPLWG